METLPGLFCTRLTVTQVDIEIDNLTYRSFQIGTAMGDAFPVILGSLVASAMDTLPLQFFTETAVIGQKWINPLAVAIPEL